MVNWAPAATKEQIEKYKQAAKFMDNLGIPFTPCGYSKSGPPYHDGFISLIQLYDVLNDEDKVKKLISMLKLKLFW